MNMDTLVTIFAGLAIFIALAVTAQWISTYRYNKTYAQTDREEQFSQFSNTMINQALERNERYTAEYKARRKGN